MPTVNPARELAARLYALAREVEWRAEAGRDPADRIIGDAVAALAAIRREYEAAQARGAGR